MPFVFRRCRTPTCNYVDVNGASVVMYMAWLAGKIGAVLEVTSSEKLSLIFLKKSKKEGYVT